MTVFEFQAQTIESNAEGFAHFIATTPEDKRDWRPMLEGSAQTRSVLELTSECVLFNRAFAALLRGEEPSLDPPALEDGADAQQQLLASARELASVVRGMDDAALERTYPTPFGPMPGAAMIEIPVRNMAYHGGQINLIQILLGDAEFHVAPQPSA
jgi:hypothetical protein